MEIDLSACDSLNTFGMGAFFVCPLIEKAYLNGATITEADIRVIYGTPTETIVYVKDQASKTLIENKFGNAQTVIKAPSTGGNVATVSYNSVNGDFQNAQITHLVAKPSGRANGDADYADLYEELKNAYLYTKTMYIHKKMHKNTILCIFIKYFAYFAIFYAKMFDYSTSKAYNKHINMI